MKITSNKKGAFGFGALVQTIQNLSKKDLSRYDWGWDWTVSGNSPIAEMQNQLRCIFKPKKWDKNKGEFGEYVPDKYNFFTKLYLFYKRFFPLIFATKHEWENNHGKIDGNRHDNYSWSLISPFKIHLNSYHYEGAGCYGDGEFTKKGQYQEKYIWQKKYKIICCYANNNGEDDYFYWIPNEKSWSSNKWGFYKCPDWSSND